MSPVQQDGRAGTSKIFRVARGVPRHPERHRTTGNREVSADKGQLEEAERGSRRRSVFIVPLVGGEPLSEGATVGKGDIGWNDPLNGKNGETLSLTTVHNRPSMDSKKGSNRRNVVVRAANRSVRGTGYVSRVSPALRGEGRSNPPDYPTSTTKNRVVFLA